MYLEKNNQVKDSAQREIFYGLRLANSASTHIARFVEYFERDSNLWLVFDDRGDSLHSLIYRQHTEGGFIRIVRSQFWFNMRTEDAAGSLFKNILGQILMGLQACHSANILHRDIKANNVVAKVTDSGDILVSLIDFGNAVDMTDFGMHYPSFPVAAESTMEYAPPEAWFTGTAFDKQRPASYDIWSVGVLALELLFGDGSNVFRLPERDVSRLMRSFPKDASQVVRKKTRHLHGLRRFCVAPTSDVTITSGSDDLMNGEVLDADPQGCGLLEFQKAVEENDPLSIGVGNPDFYDLLFSMLQWRPKDRITAEKALLHPYFQS